MSRLAGGEYLSELGHCFRILVLWYKMIGLTKNHFWASPPASPCEAKRAGKEVTHTERERERDDFGTA